MQLHHVTIRTRDVQATQDFFRLVFGLHSGQRPVAIARIPGCWMYDGEQPLVHIIESRGDGYDRAAEAIDHVGFLLTDYSDFRGRLDTLGIRYVAMDVPDSDERRLFVRAPGGPLLETVFPNTLL